MSSSLDELNKQLDASGPVGTPSEIYMNKDAFKEALTTPSPTGSKCHGRAVPDPAQEPVVEKALGSTKRIGTYGRTYSEDLPVYSHGDAKDKVVVK